MKTFKGFNEDMTCRNMVYEIGKTYTTDKAEICQTGFHACRVPLECLYYYSPSKSVYCSVEQGGELSLHQKDSKVASTEITIEEQLNINDLIQAQKDYLRHHPDFQYITADVDNKAVSTDNYVFCTVEEDGLSVGKNYGFIKTGSFGTAVGANCSVVQGDSFSTVVAGGYSIAKGGYNSTVVARDSSFAETENSGIAVTGERGNSSAGNYGCSVTGADGKAEVGNCGIALGGQRSRVKAYNMGIAVGGKDVVVGKGGIGVVRGKNGRAKGGKGATLIFIEMNDGDYEIKDKKIITIDGKVYKEDTYYTLVDGEVVEVDRWKEGGGYLAFSGKW